jgi:hypothetical protein
MESCCAVAAVVPGGEATQVADLSWGRRTSSHRAPLSSTDCSWSWTCRRPRGSLPFSPSVSLATGEEGDSASGLMTVSSQRRCWAWCRRRPRAVWNSAPPPSTPHPSLMPPPPCPLLVWQEVALQPQEMVAPLTRCGVHAGGGCDRRARGPVRPVPLCQRSRGRPVRPACLCPRAGTALGSRPSRCRDLWPYVTADFCAQCTRLLSAARCLTASSSLPPVLCARTWCSSVRYVGCSG